MNYKAEKFLTVAKDNRICQTAYSPGKENDLNTYQHQLLLIVIARMQKDDKNFKVEGTASNGCTATASKELKIWPLPNVKIDSIYKLGCPDKGTDVKLFAKGAKDLVWESDIYNEAIDDMSHDSLIANIKEK